ncbi:phosphonate C-P lyase system protein PhnG [Desulfovibrio litoralis]|uniref:Alpha-D-ribose 1-methylphosphonate 5-triphosphate synthase subunit PhnG n=1 Tax=Desulfovibrio litoralis DSM 11393 TaxID=1121455 RepID=A0A1M7SSV8_9BACT|nr:phosphonate C-P lyase system protein PhnG [Desulfovibrio litoralis]SHN61572.1 alpha-D-ribose 1-methylphosphonate 5-triphosphate synthase subunit PhnG [Desulfovibrio litoralis DSM 11393]
MKEELHLSSPKGNINIQLRQKWMATLSCAELQDLEDAISLLPNTLSYHYLKAPEAGLIMLKAKTGDKSHTFNMGELLVTRCIVSLTWEQQSTTGYAFIKGDSQRHAELAAVYDALMQIESFNKILSTKLISPLNLKQKNKKQQMTKEIAETKVDFFTMVRGEDE